MYDIGLESIQVQSGDFFKSIAESIEFIRKDARYTTEAIKESNIMELIRLQTGLQVSFHIEKDSSYGAYVYLPNVDKNHPFIESHFRRFMNSGEGISALTYKDTVPVGKVDTRTGKVSGWFSEIRHQMHLCLGLLKSREVSNEEIAAIILHELGHLFTYYLHLGTTVVSNLYLGTMARQIVGAKDFHERKYVLEEAERTLGIEIPNKEILAKTAADKNASGVQTVVLTSLAEKSRYETGFNIYEMRACEQIADKFAISHGAGIHLATALDKIYSRYGNPSYRNRMCHVMMEIMKLTLFLAGGLLLGPIVLILAFVFIGNPWEKRYDDPKARLELIASNLTEEIKSRKLPEQRRKQLIEDINQIKSLTSNIEDKRTLNQWFWRVMSSSGRSATKQEEMAKEIIELSNNELFLNASQFALVNDELTGGGK